MRTAALVLASETSPVSASATVELATGEAQLRDPRARSRESAQTPEIARPETLQFYLLANETHIPPSSSASWIARALLAGVLASTIWQAVPLTQTGFAPGPGTAISTDSATAIIEAARTNAFRVFRELVRLLRVSDDQVARLVGIGRTTPYAWERVGREPRPNTVRRLYQYHSLLTAVRRQLGSTDFSNWLESSRPAPRDLLLAGNLEIVARSAQPILFGRSYLPVVGLGAAQDELSTPRALPANRLTTNDVRVNRRRARWVRE